MNGRARCGCPICVLEQGLLSELREHHEVEYQQITSQSPILSAFPTCTELLGQLHGPHVAQGRAAACDAVLGELLRMSRERGQATVHLLILLVLMPAMHKTSRYVAARFPSLARDDIAQHLVTAVLEILRSKAIRAQTTHFAFVITRSMRRSVFRWALHEADLAPRADADDAGATAVSPAGGASLETNVQLRDFLGRCLGGGLLTQSEHEQLLLFKIQGVSSDVLASQNGLSNVAFRHRMQRVVDKLRRAAQSSTPKHQGQSAAA
jgi:DNA-directed RNA polymerase specialized sigma24 family protein